MVAQLSLTRNMQLRYLTGNDLPPPREPGSDYASRSSVKIYVNEGNRHGKKESVTNTDAVEITRIDMFSLVKMFTGIISGIAVMISVCGLLVYYFIIRGNMIFLPEAYAGLFQFFTIPAIIGWLVAVIVISSIGGFLLVGMYNVIARKTGGIVLSMKK